MRSAPVSGERQAAAGPPVRGGRAFVARVVIRPAQAFVATETASGVVLLAATIAALIWANSPWKDSYHDLWSAKLGLDLAFTEVEFDLQHFVNDGLMAVFFFVVGLEIKREVLHGELASPRRAALPAMAALGGMVAPALIYVGWNAGGTGQHGWGIPMATDIAFALGALALLGSRAPFQLKVFLLALAIVDDLGAIAVIAVFYSESISWVAVGWAVALGVLIFAMGRSGIRWVDLYVFMGAVFWLAVFQSGIHATIAGVALAVLTPAKAYYGPEAFDSAMQGLLANFRDAVRRGDSDAAQSALLQVEELGRDSESPLDRLEHILHPWVSFGIVPVFALANAGVELSRTALSDAASSTVTAGVALGLVVGKPVGILLFSWLAIKLGLGEMPEGMRWGHVLGGGLVAGIGFTVSLFVTGLAFSDAQHLADAKLGILGASIVAGAAGLAYLTLYNGRQAQGNARTGN